jgi:hypothetical protein
MKFVHHVCLAKWLAAPAHNRRLRIVNHNHASPIANPKRCCDVCGGVFRTETVFELSESLRAFAWSLVHVDWRAVRGRAAFLSRHVLMTSHACTCGVWSCQAARLATGTLAAVPVALLLSAFLWLFSDHDRELIPLAQLMDAAALVAHGISIVPLAHKLRESIVFATRGPMRRWRSVQLTSTFVMLAVVLVHNWAPKWLLGTAPEGFLVFRNVAVSAVVVVLAALAQHVVGAFQSAFKSTVRFVSVH